MHSKVVAAKWDHEALKCDENNLIAKICSKMDNIRETLFVLAYFSDSVKLGYYKDKKIHFHEEEEIDTKKLEEIRIFNKSLELRLIRTEILEDGTRTFIGRVISEVSTSYDREKLIDSDSFIYDEKFLVYGRGLEKGINWTKAKEDRGGELWLPIEGMKWLGVRNYLEYKDELKFVGNRLLGFYDDKGKYLGGEISGN